jgi:phage protein U
MDGAEHKKTWNLRDGAEQKKTWYLVNGAEQKKTWYLVNCTEQNKTRVLMAGNDCDGVGKKYSDTEYFVKFTNLVVIG